MSFRLFPLLGLAITAVFCTSASAWPGPGPDFYPPPPSPLPPQEVAAPQSPVWVEKSQDFRYYCPDPAGYYPKVPRCPKGWMKVVASN